MLAARIIPAVLFTLAGGVLVDRVPRRLVMLVSDLVRGLAVAVVCVLAATGHIDLIGLILMAFVFGIGDAGFYPASVAITPELVPAEMLLGASALTGTSLQLAGVLLGPAIGGLLVGFLGTAWGFGIDAASFLISAAAIYAMTGRSTPISSEQSPLADLREGLRFCLSEPWLWTTTLGTALGNFVAFSPLGEGVPESLLGRVSSVDYVFCFALSPLGLIAAGAAAQTIGVRLTLIIGGAIAALTTFIPLLPGVEDPTIQHAQGAPSTPTETAR